MRCNHTFLLKGLRSSAMWLLILLFESPFTWFVTFFLCYSFVLHVVLFFIFYFFRFLFYNLDDSSIIWIVDWDWCFRLLILLFKNPFINFFFLLQGLGLLYFSWIIDWDWCFSEMFHQLLGFDEACSSGCLTFSSILSCDFAGIASVLHRATVLVEVYKTDSHACL